MSPSSESWTIRRPMVDDAPDVVDLMNACDVAEYGEPDSDLGDLRHEWTQIDLTADAWLAFKPGDDLAGYASVFEGDGNVDFDIYVHPMYGDAELRGLLLHECEVRAKALHAGAPKLGSTARTIVSQVNEAQRAILEAAGYEPAKYYFRMQIELDELPEPSAWPDGCTLRTVIPEQDDRAVYDLIQKAFERPGRTAPGFEAWRDAMMRPDLFDAGLWFLLSHDGEQIAAALCFDYDQYGWVRQLGVDPAWRRRGLGQALLRHAFRTFYERGRTAVALGVDAERLTAQRLYESVGMTCVRRFDEYRKPLRSSE